MNAIYRRVKVDGVVILLSGGDTLQLFWAIELV